MSFIKGKKDFFNFHNYKYFGFSCKYSKTIPARKG
nr:MAG TPA: hypothetical protein [Caudoviricetes sp.]